jgi:hypothetical protein
MGNNRMPGRARFSARCLIHVEANAIRAFASMIQEAPSSRIKGWVARDAKKYPLSTMLSGMWSGDHFLYSFLLQENTNPAFGEDGVV